MPHLLVTGGAGFIGSNFVHYMSAHRPDYKITVLDKLTYAGNLDNLDPVAHLPGFRFVKGDICDRNAVRDALTGCDWVVNFAAETHVDRSIIEPGSFVMTDVYGTYTLLEASKECSVKKFIQVSTDEVYGNAEAPSGESRPSLETDALKPLSPYAASKAGADRLVFSYWATYNLPVIITRCSNNYGPYQYPEKQIPLFIVNALAGRNIPIYGDGRNTRDWIHTRDHAKAIDLLLQSTGQEGEVFNVGTNTERSILENATTILKILGKPTDLLTFVPDRLGHVRRHAVNSNKLIEKIGWQPEISFDQGLEETVRWYVNNQQWLDRLTARKDDFLHSAQHLAMRA